MKLVRRGERSTPKGKATVIDQGRAACKSDKSSNVFPLKVLFNWDNEV